MCLIKCLKKFKIGPEYLSWSLWAWTYLSRDPSRMNSMMMIPSSARTALILTTFSWFRAEILIHRKWDMLERKNNLNSNIVQVKNMDQKGSELWFQHCSSYISWYQVRDEARELLRRMTPDFSTSWPQPESGVEIKWMLSELVNMHQKINVRKSCNKFNAIKFLVS